MWSTLRRLCGPTSRRRKRQTSPHGAILARRAIRFCRCTRGMRMSAPRRKKPKAAARRPKKAVAETIEDTFAEMEENQHPRGDALLAPVSFEEEDDLPCQTLSMAVVRGWFK